MHSEAKVAVGVAALYFANITTLALNTVFLVLLTNVLDVSDVGLVTFLNVLLVTAATVAVMALPVTGAGVAATPPAVARFLSASGDEAASPRRVYFVSALICAGISVAVFLLLAYGPIAAAIGGPFDSGPVFFAGLDVVVFSFGQLGAYSMLGTGQATSAGKLIVGSSVLRYFAAGLLLALGAGPSGVFMGFVLGDLSLAILSNASAGKSVGRLKSGSGGFAPVAGYMVSVFLAALVGVGVSQTDKLLAFLQQGLGNLAVYNVAATGAAVASFAPSAATNVLVPALSTYADPERRKSMLRTYTRYISLTAVPIGFVLAAVSPFLLQVFGEAYAAGWPLLAIVSVSISLSSVAAVYSSSLLVDDRAHHFTVSSLVALAGLVVVAVATVPYLGLTGIALGRAAMLFVMLGAVAYFARHTGMLVLDSDAYAKSVGASAAMGVVVYAALFFIATSVATSRAITVVSAVAMVPLGLCLYLLLMKGMKAFNESDLEFVDAILPRPLRFVSRLARMLL